MSDIAAAWQKWHDANAKVAEADSVMRELWLTYDETGKSPSPAAVERAQSLRKIANDALWELQRALAEDLPPLPSAD